MVQFGKSLEMFEMPLKINGTFYSVEIGKGQRPYLFMLYLWQILLIQININILKTMYVCRL